MPFTKSSRFFTDKPLDPLLGLPSLPPLVPDFDHDEPLSLPTYAESLPNLDHDAPLSLPEIPALDASPYDLYIQTLRMGLSL